MTLAAWFSASEAIHIALQAFPSCLANHRQLLGPCSQTGGVFLELPLPRFPHCLFQTGAKEVHPVPKMTRVKRVGIFPCRLEGEAIGVIQGCFEHSASFLRFAMKPQRFYLKISQKKNLVESDLGVHGLSMFCRNESIKRFLVLRILPRAKNSS